MRGTLTPGQHDKLISRLVDIEVRANSIRRALSLEVFEAHYLDELLRAVRDVGLTLEDANLQGESLTPDLRRALAMEAFLTRWDVLIAEL